MKVSLLVAAFLLFFSVGASAQVVYSLPQTSVSVKVKVKKTTFMPGPYAAYSLKYLGASATRSESVNYVIEEVSLTPKIEADPAVSIALNLGGFKNATANFLSFSKYGLLVAPGYFNFADGSSSAVYNDDPRWSDGVQAVSNLGVKTTQLYKSVVNEAGEIEKIAVPQTQVVEKNAEQKASETADLIFKLRQKRVDILTGETDANYYSGAALGAAIEEIARLEKAYVALFMGQTFVSRQEASFEVVPNAQNAKQTYVAFRISDTQGLVPPDNISGRPVYLDLSKTEGDIDGAVSEADIVQSKNRIVYRTPLMVTAKILDNQNVMGLCRIPVYQFGRTLVIPMETALGK